MAKKEILEVNMIFQSLCNYILILFFKSEHNPFKSTIVREAKTSLRLAKWASLDCGARFAGQPVWVLAYGWLKTS